MAAMIKLFKALARAILPASNYRKLIFSRIYQIDRWGSDGSKFFSGVGSRGLPVGVYVDAVARELTEPHTIVDLGCGDFVVGRELLKRFPEALYIGCDIVPGLIQHHQRFYADERVSFRVLDIVSERIPDGDVHLVRQVFQHLSNADISRTLEKLRASPCVIVTEGLPMTESGPVNPNKFVSGDTRFDTSTGIGSGVHLDKPPFNKRLEELCRVELPGSEQIVTWRVR